MFNKKEIEIILRGEKTDTIDGEKILQNLKLMAVHPDAIDVEVKCEIDKLRASLTIHNPSLTKYELLELGSRRISTSLNLGELMRMDPSLLTPVIHTFPIRDMNGGNSLIQISHFQTIKEVVGTAKKALQLKGDFELIINSKKQNAEKTLAVSCLAEFKGGSEDALLVVRKNVKGLKL